ncbi:MAG: DUF6452 family protein [Bacteroidota bacterium]
MKILKIFTLLILIIFIFFSCEKDEICLEENTPRLIIRFYDVDEPETLKKVSQLAVRVDGVEEFYLEGSIATDSIAIPIKVDYDSTSIELVLNGSDLNLDNDNSDFINLTYIREDVFVSRSCGYKTFFNDVNAIIEPDDDNWIKDILTIELPQNIIDENNAHLKIYH